MKIAKGQVYYADLSGNKGSEQGGFRPVLIIQNDVGNSYSPTTIAAVITTRKTKAKLPTHIWLDRKCGLPCESMVELEQVRTIDKSRLAKYVGTITQEDMKKVNKGIAISFEI